MNSFSVSHDIVSETLSRKEMIARIEALVLEFLEGLKEHTIIPFEMNEWDNIKGESVKKKRDFNHSRSMESYTKVWLVTQMVHDLLVHKQTSTQRDIFYSMIRHFPDQRSLNERVLDVASIFKCTRRSLNVTSSPKGVIAGSIIFNDDYGNPQDLSTVSVGLSIFEGLADKIEQNGTSSARYILVVEKESVFNRLCEDKIWKMVPLILISGRGFPDQSTRILLKKVSDRFNVPVLGLFDYNLGGFRVFMNYKFGSKRVGLDAECPVDIKWLGLHYNQIDELQQPPYDLNESILVPSSERTKTQLDSLISSDEMANSPTLLEELKRMRELGFSVELQAMNSSSSQGHSLLTNFVAKMICKRKWIS